MHPAASVFSSTGFGMPSWLIILGGFVLAFSITFLVIPSIVRVSVAKHLFDPPGYRKSHNRVIPTLGGTAVFLGMIIPTVLFGDGAFDHQLKFIFISVLILFFIGVKDDILIISPRTKLISELLAIGIVVVLGNIRITSFQGFFGIEELPYLPSVLFTMFVFVVIINGMNLIDGIDGLASGVGILAISCLGAWFIVARDFHYATFCFSAVGALVAFFRYNVFGIKNKIFLGDTGSLILGLIMTVFTIRFLEENLTETIASIDLAAPAIAIAILIVPLIDTLRVFIIRLSLGKSPFKPDRLHLHHRLVELEFTHLASSFIILGFNAFIVALAIFFRHLGNIKVLLIILPVSILVTSIPGLIFRYRAREVMEQLNLFGNKTWILPITLKYVLFSSQIHIRRTPERPAANPVYPETGMNQPEPEKERQAPVEI